MQKWYLVFVLLFGATLIGCLGDDVELEVKYRPIIQPPRVMFRAEANGDLIAQWSPSPTDTQTNFKGYYVELYSSIDTAEGDIDDVIDLIDTAHTPKSDTFYVFKNITPGRYTLKVYGERIPDPNNPDSLVLSEFPTTFSFSFDPTPVIAPKVFLAHSRGQSTVAIYWEPSASIVQPGMAGYILRYRDNTKLNSDIFTLRITGSGASPQTQVLTFPMSADGFERDFQIWIKSVRNDSTESADSTIIVWSGARAVGVGQSTVRLDTMFFIGQTNFGYEIKEAPTGQIGFSATDSTITLQAFDGALFAKRIDESTLDSVYFQEPMPIAAFTETTLTLPRNPVSNVCFYVLFAKTQDESQARARIMFVKDLGGTLIHGLNSIRAEARFQPGTPPYFLPYF